MGDPPLRKLLVPSVFCFKLDTKSIPETLATTIRILLMFTIVLAHRWNPGVWVRPTPRGRLLGTPWHPPGHPSAPADPPDSWVTVRRGGPPPEGGTRPEGGSHSPTKHSPLQPHARRVV